MAEISPSILSADFNSIFQIINDLEGKVESVHLDIMDDKFVPNYTLDRFNPEFVSQLKGRNIVKNVHLMVEDHLKWGKEFAEAGSDEIAFHYETGKIEEGIAQIKKYGIRAGMSIKPATQPQALEKYFPDLDFILVMSVEPGFSGQAFMPNALPKIKWLKENYAVPYGGKIWVDGGVKKGIATECVKAGVDSMVISSAIFNDKAPFLDNLAELKKEIDGVRLKGD